METIQVYLIKFSHGFFLLRWTGAIFCGSLSQFIGLSVGNQWKFDNFDEPESKNNILNFKNKIITKLRVSQKLFLKINELAKYMKRVFLYYNNIILCFFVITSF